ncbi:MAG: nucleotidyltransferase domain-containing protein [archaeon]
MLNQKEINDLSEGLIKRFSDIKLIIQFGSSVSGDYNKDISDVDLAIITNSKRIEKKIRNFIFRIHISFEIQIHIFSIKLFIKNLKEAEPLSLSVLYTGNALYNEEYHLKLKNKFFKADNKTVRKCMLNSFGALGLGISDLTNDMLQDSINSFYHAARSSIWATLFNEEITPNNKKIFELVKNKKIRKLYKRIIDFRKNIPDYETDINLSKKIYKKGNINHFTQILKDTIEIVKINYKKTFKKDFVGFFDILRLLNKRYKRIHDYYSVFLSVNWKREIPFYFITFSFKNKKWLLIEINANNRKIKETILKES